MEFSVEEIAQLIGGEVEGARQARIHTMSKIQEGTPGSLSFLANEKYEPFIYQTAATAVLVHRDFVPQQALETTLIRVPDPYAAFARLLEEYNRLRQTAKVGIEQPSFIDPSAQLGKGVYVGAFAYIGKNARIADGAQIYPQVYVGDNVHIGSHTTLFSGAKIYADTQIGRHCVVHSGAVIGSDGFGFAPQADGSYQTIPQMGNVILEDYVSIGANTTIDCATLGTTHLHEGVKIDNLVQIAHNVTIGAHTVIAAQTGVSGSTTIGAQCVIAGQVGIVGHIQIGDKTTIGAQSGISKSFTAGNQTLLGSPAYPYKESARIYAVSRRLPEIKRRLDQLERQLENLENNKNSHA